MKDQLLEASEQMYELYEVLKLELARTKAPRRLAIRVEDATVNVAARLHTAALLGSDDLRRSAAKRLETAVLLLDQLHRQSFVSIALLLWAKRQMALAHHVSSVWIMSADTTPRPRSERSLN